jgi:uncharacterized protein involved in exopolysaccharide biosynthesis/Mrp family chromosome partitioning ATPase
MSGVSNQTNQDRDVDIDLAALASAVWRKKIRIGILAASCAAIALVGSSLISPKYQSETRLLIESGESVFTQPASGTQSSADPNDSVMNPEAVASQVEILKSTDLLRKIATDLKLADLEEFDEAANMSALSRVMVTVGLMDNPLDVPPDLRVLKAMKEKLEVFPVEKSRVVVVKFSSKDPKLAEAVPNALAEAYLGLQRDNKQSINSGAADFLQPEIDALRERVKTAEARVADFKASADILDGQNQSTLATQQLGELSSELSRVRANRGSAEATSSAMRAALASGASLDTLPSVQSSGLIDRLREKRVDIATNIADLSVNLLDGHPKLKALRAQLNDLDGQIRTEAKKVLVSLDTLADTARKREQQLVIDLNRLKSEAARAGGQSVELRALEREANAQSQLLESYLARFREASARTDNNYVPADARIIAMAPFPSESYFPKKVPITIAAFFAGLLAGVMGALLSELFSGRAMRRTNFAPEFNTASVEERAEPVVSIGEAVAEAPAAVAPSLLGKRKTITAPSIDPADLVPIDQRVDSVADELVASGCQRAVFISPEGDPGAAGAVMVARRMADNGMKVLVVDLTTSAIATRTMLDDAKTAGLTNLLCRDTSLADCISQDLYSDAFIVSRGNASSAKAMRNADRLPDILDQLNETCEIMVIECGAADLDMLNLVVSDDTQTSLIVSAVKSDGPAVMEIVDALGGAEACMRVTPLLKQRRVA